MNVNNVMITTFTRGKYQNMKSGPDRQTERLRKRWLAERFFAVRIPRMFRIHVNQA